VAATYDINLATDKDWIRLLIGDRNMANPALQDEEINGLLAASGGNRYIAAYEAGMTIFQRNSGIVSKQVGDLRIQYSSGQTAGDAYLKYLLSLRERGLSQSGRQHLHVFDTNG
jgi:hypothetical protein